jgi:large subunit ribosomal protein L21
MTQYAIIKLGGKQYVVKEGENLLVDRLDREEGKTFQPDVLFLGGKGAGELAPKSPVTAKVLGHVRGPKIRIGKYKAKKGYKRHTGFRSALTRIEVTGIGGKQTAAKAEAPPAPKEKEKAPVAEAPKEKAAVAETPKEKTPVAEAPKGLPKGYAEMTVAQISEGAKSWNRPMLDAALAYEQEHAKRKGALAALESALAAKEES